MLRVGGAMGRGGIQSMSILPNFQSLFWARKTLWRAFSSHMVCYIVINNFFVSFEISGGSYNPSQGALGCFGSNTRIRGCIPSFMESLIANFITKIFSFSNLFGNSWGNSYIQFVVIVDLVLIHLWWKETRQTDKKVLKYFMRGCSFLKVGSVKAYVKKVTMS